MMETQRPCIYELETTFYADIIKRPSASCKTPYVADVQVHMDANDHDNTDGDDQNKDLAHCPALGCCGLSDASAKVIVSKLTKKTAKSVCNYRVELAEHNERGNVQYIGINPKLAENIVDSCLKNNLFTTIHNVQHFKREVKFLNSRFDFAGVDEHGKPFVLEVKNVPLADYEDCLAKDKKHMDFSDRAYNSKVSYFPDGYRKKVVDTVSPRALKHIQELEEIVKKGEYRAILCFVIQRTDISSFQPSIIDPIYRNALIQAYQSGVEIIPLVCSWTHDGKCHFVRDDLPINI